MKNKPIKKDKRKILFAIGGIMIVFVFIITAICYRYWNRTKEKTSNKYISYFKGNSQYINKTEERKKTFVIGVSNIPTDTKVYEHDTEAGHITENLVYEPLIRIDTMGRITNVLAQNITFSNNGKKARIELKQALFSDKTNLKPEDIIASYERVATERSESYKKAFLSSIKGVSEYQEKKSDDIQGIKKIDDQTVEITFNHTQASNLLAFTIPIQKLEKEEKSDVYPLGTGPYKISNIIFQQQMEFVKNEEYQNSPYDYDTIQIRTMERNKLDEELQEHKVDLFYMNGKQDLDSIKKNNGYDIYQARKQEYQYLGFNLKSKVGKDVKVRQAIAYAIDQKSLEEKNTVFSNGVASYGIITTDNIYGSKENLPSQNVKKAKELWKDSKEKKITMVSLPDEYSLAYANEIKEELKKAGISVEIKENETEEESKTGSEQNYTATLQKEEGDFYLDLSTEQTLLELIEQQLEEDSSLEKKYEENMKKIFTKNYTEVYNNVEDFCIENQIIIPVVASSSFIAVSSDCDKERMMDLFY